MIDTDEGDNSENMDFGDNISPIPICQIIHDDRSYWVIEHLDLRRQERFCNLQNDLVEHLWARRESMG